MASESPKTGQSLALLDHLRNLRDMEAGIVGIGNEESSRVKLDPVGAAEQLAEYTAFMLKDLRARGSERPRLELIAVGDLMSKQMPERTPLFAWEGRPIIYKDALYLGDGLTRAGKGMLVGAALPVALAAGAGWGKFHACRPARAVIVTVEDTERRLQHRIRCFIRGLGVEPDALGDRLALVVRPRGGLQLDNAAHVAELLDLIAPYRPDFLYLDNLARMSEGDENTSEIRPAMEAADAIREETGAATILVHHWGKDNEGRRGVHRSRGWSGIPGFVEAHLTVTRPEGSETATLSHHDGKDDEDLALDFTLIKQDDVWWYDLAEAHLAAKAAADTPKARVRSREGTSSEEEGRCYDNRNLRSNDLVRAQRE